MGDLDYEQKFMEMQKYIPFLDRVIEKLKNNDQDNPRKAQLEKMQTLHSLLNNKQKKLKIETLLKCESVLKKLHAKIEKSDDDNKASNELKNPMTTESISSENLQQTKSQLGKQSDEIYNTQNVLKDSMSISSAKVNTYSTSALPRPPRRWQSPEINKDPMTTTSITSGNMHTSAAPRGSVTKNKFVPNNNLIEIYTCPASPPQFGEFNFPPPVEIPTERRSSPIKQIGTHHQIENKIKTHVTTSSSPMFDINSLDFYHSNITNEYNYPQLPDLAQSTTKSSRWSDSRDRVTEISPSTSFHHRPCSSSSTSTSTGSFSSASNNHRPNTPKKIESKSKYSSEEENWDEPEEEPAPKPKPIPKVDPRPTLTLTPPLPSSTYSLHKDLRSSHHNRPHERSSKPEFQHQRSQPPPGFPPLPDIHIEKDAYQKKLYHDTIYKYKKPEPPTIIHLAFMNPPPPEHRTQMHSPSNVFNRLGDKVDHNNYENFRIEVKNDMMKSKSQKEIIHPSLISPSKIPLPPAPPLPSPHIQIKPPPPPPPLSLFPHKPIVDVLNSPPLSAEDIDDLLNESLEAALKNQKKENENLTTRPSSLDAVRKKLAKISMPISSPDRESPTRSEPEEEPFYRRGHTPTRKPGLNIQPNKVDTQSNKQSESSVKNYVLPSPASPTNPMDNVIERLALKYNPHRRRDSASKEKNYNLQTDKPSPSASIKDPTGYNQPFNRQESLVSPIRTSDPRVNKMITHTPPLLTSPLNISPVPNILPGVNFDPRRRSTHLSNNDHSPKGLFCPSKSYQQPLPSLRDLHINIPPVPNSVQPPPLSFNQTPPANRIDPRTQKPSTIYADKFNPERNDKTERMKYFESKKNKQPEPKTYGEYRQSKCRKFLEEGKEKARAAIRKAPETLSVAPTPSNQPIMPSTLDKMYRNCDYGKELIGSIQGFKIPKKIKPTDQQQFDDGENSKLGSASSLEDISSKSKEDKETTKKSEDNLVDKSDEDFVRIPDKEIVKKPDEYFAKKSHKESLKKSDKDLTKGSIEDLTNKSDEEDLTKKHAKKSKRKSDKIQAKEIVQQSSEDLFESIKNQEEPKQNIETPPKENEDLSEKLSKSNKKNKPKVQQDTDGEDMPKRTIKTRRQSLFLEKEKQKEGKEPSGSVEKESAPEQMNESLTESNLVIDESENVTKPKVKRPRRLSCKNVQAPEQLNESLTESILIIDESESCVQPKVTRPRRASCKDVQAPEQLNESITESTLVIDESENVAQPKVTRPRRLSCKPTAVISNTTEPDEKTEEDEQKQEEKKVKPRRISSRRSTIVKEQPIQIKKERSETPSPSSIYSRPRSASDIFSPTTDNSVVSTQNIISGKRKTRASINFNEKNTKKPVTPKPVTPPTIETPPTPKARSKRGPKPGFKKLLDEQTKLQKSEKETTSEDGQICAVSSTTEGPHHEHEIITESTISPEEPSSSNINRQTPTPTPTIDADENKKKQEWLEGFLMSIVDPSTNKDRILDMLKTVLDDTKLQQVKDILYSSEKDDTKDAIDKSKEPQEQNKPRIVRPKKNELDRLNEDIRDMFICQGVVTATGRRMCTLAKDAKEEPPKKCPVQIKKKNIKPTNTNPKADKSPVNKPAASSVLGKRSMRKAKVIISPLNMRALRSRNQGPARPPKMPVLAPNTPIKFSSEHNNTSSDDSIADTPLTSKTKADDEMFKPLKKKPGPKSKRVPSEEPESCSDSSDDDIQLVFLKNKIMRMEQNKSNEDKKSIETKIKKEVETELEVKDKKTKKQAIKSASNLEVVKKKTIKTPVEVKKKKKEETKEMANTELDAKKTICKKKDTRNVSQEDIQTETKIHSQEIEIEGKKEDKTEIKIKTNKKEKHEIQEDIQKKDEKTHEELKEQDNNTTANSQKLKEKSEIVPKNTNPEWHSMSAYSSCCVICKEKARFIAPHYHTAHNDSEVYTSRLPPTVLEHIKLNIGNRALYVTNKKIQTAYHFLCPFCEFEATNSLRVWLEHFTIHTGEYGYKCSVCFKSMNSSHHIGDHIKRMCPNAKKINRDPINLRSQIIFGYVCHLCNFIQLLRGGIVRHLKIHHDLEDEVSLANIIEIKLVDTAGVPKLEDENKKNISLPEIALPTAANTSILTDPLASPVPMNATISNIPLSVSPTPTNTSILPVVPSISPASPENTSVLIAPTASSSPNKMEVPTLPSVDTSKEIESSTPIQPQNIEVFIPRDLASNKEIESSTPIQPQNIEVFIPRDLASPTSTDLTESLKAIEKDVVLESDSNQLVDALSSPCKEKPIEKKITIAEKLSQRFKNIEKQTVLEDAITETNSEITNKENDTPEVSMPVEPDVHVQPPAEETPSSSNMTNLPMETEVLPEQVLDQSLNESNKLIIDEDMNDKALSEYDDCSDSDGDGGNGNEEDDNDNWEDIEITETKGGSQKDKNKNKSIFQTLSRLYASIAPKKGLKKNKDKDKEKEKEKEKKRVETPQPQEKPTAEITPKPVTLEKTLDPPTTISTVSRTATQQHRISNLSEFLPDSPSDSLDILLSGNFNCLEGDGTSFPHLDLNDLDSSIFHLPEEQSNIQDAIALATDLDQNRYDVLGNPLPSKDKPKSSVSSILASNIQRIGNYGFTLFGNSVKYYCMVKSCAFLFSDHPDGLENHFIMEHPKIKWNGYCHTCDMQVSCRDSREMLHMLDAHSKTKTGDKPRIKFRRLTGDILSIDKQQQVMAPTAAIETQLIPIPSQANELSLSTMLQSEPKAMIPPKIPPSSINLNIPLFKNVSKEFTITNVVQGVTDGDLSNLVFNKNESTKGGIQISQVISLNAGGKSVSPAPAPMPASMPVSMPASTPASMPQISDRNPAIERRNSPSLKERPTISKEKELQIQRSSPNLMNPKSQRSSPLPRNPSPREPAFMCCVTKCLFSTNILSAMHEHILVHIRSDNNRDSLKCYLCSFKAQDTNHYFKHMKQVHLISEAVSTSCSSTVELTQSIQDILRTTSNKNQPSEKLPENRPEEVEAIRNISFSNRLRKTAEEVVAETGLPESEIWKCIFHPECTYAVTEKDFQTHLATHTSIVPTSFPSISPGSSLNCPHCTANYYRPAVLKAHLKNHARHQFFCYMCSCATFSNCHQVQKHFSENHSPSGILRTQALIPEEKFEKPTFQIASETELTSVEVIQFGEKLILDWERKKALNKTHFKPNEQYLLPIQPIFNNQVFCSVCNYKTKVRTNMFRHLQLHKQDIDVGSVDPVNPVPCLEKNEKHFDKMLNLACSSNAGGGTKNKESVKIPVFVPDLRRFVCGHPGCKYLTITDQMFRSHLNALHGSEKGYQCPHCQEDVCKKNMCAERIVQHLKFHGSKIYQCSECEYFHYTKHVVERHVHEKHPTVSFVNLLTYDRNENETKKGTQLVPGRNVTVGHQAPGEYDSPELPAPSNTSSSSSSSKFKWECALCKHQTATWNQMISHANSAHNAKHQYHCVHCPFGAAHLAHIMDHIDNKHPTKIREAKYVFYKINETVQDKAADTRPLWSRNDPKRVRSIRGILMENEEDAERTKRSLSNAGVDFDDEDDDIEVIQGTESDAPTIPGGLSCFHCSFTSVDMSSLTSHWKTKHWHLKNYEMVPKIPFFFRINNVLKCPLCTHIGDHVTLKIHLANVHGQQNFCAADPKLPNTCGHCPFAYPTSRLEVLISHYHRDHKPTDVKNLSSTLLKSLLALGECQVYMQCYFCAEICADQTAIIEHERERHKNSNFRYKQIKDEVIYRCGMCQYSSTNELATLRHMIDHFSGFTICHFCKSSQSNFNSYMQHCYANHSKALTGFKEIYKLDKISEFLGQMLLIFPNGLIVSKKNLIHTQYGNAERILAMYDEICKKALEPPIPPLCMARLLAKKSLESCAKPLLPPPSAVVSAKRIAKRRSTVAMGGGSDRGFSDFLVPPEPMKIKKRKSSICEDFSVPTAPLFSTITSKSSTSIGESSTESFKVPQAVSEQSPQGFSFYGKKPEPIDLSKIYTQIAIGDKYAPVSVKKFSLLFKMNAKVLVEHTDPRRYQVKKRPTNSIRPCPASKKMKYA